MEAIQIKKRELEKELKEVIDRFHKEVQIYRVSYVSVKSHNTVVCNKEGSVLNSPVKVEINLEVL